MNIKVLQWLLKNQDVLRKVAAVASGWKNDLSYAAKWQIVSAIAELVIPLLEKDGASPRALAAGIGATYDADGAVVVDGAPYPLACVGAGAEVQAMGIDWRLVTEVIIPIIIGILQAFVAKSQ